MVSMGLGGWPVGRARVRAVPRTASFSSTPRVSTRSAARSSCATCEEGKRLQYDPKGAASSARGPHDGARCRHAPSRSPMHPRNQKANRPGRQWQHAPSERGAMRH